MKELPRGFRILLLASLIAGLLLRTLWLSDMEYKEDEEFNFVQSQLVGGIHPWPWVGMPSGVYLVNPGMSVWVFAALAKLSLASTPVGLARALGTFSFLGICLILVLAFRFLRSAREREPWLWAFALAMVNPFAILYQRKLWPEPFFMVFSMIFIIAWWRRDRWRGAFFWGLIGAILGQIHMSGFFLAAAVFLWTALFGQQLRSGHDPAEARRTVRWAAWLAGSALGALPLIPWAHYLLTHPRGGAISSGWEEAIQLKFWVFWVSDALGLHLGNPLGLHLGRNLEQLRDFARYPLVGGRSTYLTGLAHLVIALVAAWILLPALVRMLRRPARWRSLAIGRSSPTAFLQSAAFWGYGALLTASTVMIRRYYMMVSFPLEFVWLARLALSGRRLPRLSLWILWLAQLFVSAAFVGYVHVNAGAIHGDYGQAFHRLMRERGTLGPPSPPGAAGQ